MPRAQLGGVQRPQRPARPRRAGRGDRRAGVRGSRCWAVGPDNWVGSGNGFGIPSGLWIAAAGAFSAFVSVGASAWAHRQSAQGASRPSPRTPRSFTPDQERAISVTDREVLVVAPAGSGKTEVLVQRVVRTLEHSAGEAFRLLVVTFTVKAAEELKQRARETIADELWRVDADTIHGFALDWLKRYGKDIGIDPDVVVLSDDIDRVAVIAGYLRSIGLGDGLDGDGGTGIRDVLRNIDAHRTRHNGRDCGCSRDYSYLGVSLEELADAYGAALRAQGAIDFPGMLLSFADLLDEDQWVLEHFRTLYRYILVDEGQDLTAIQSRLLRRLAGDSINVFVVADDRQSIRGYAGGAFSHAKALVPSAARGPLHLRHNFRCAKEILHAAETVLRTTGGKRHVIALDSTPPGKVSFLPMASPEAEADWIASWVSKLLESGLGGDTVAQGEDPSVVPEDIAVAGRTRWTLAPVVEALTRLDIGFVAQTDARVFLPEPEARLFVDGLSFGVNNRGIRLPGAGLIFSSGNGRKWTEPSGKLLHDEVVPAQICRHRGVGLCGCEEAGNEGHEGRLAGRRTCAEHVAVESAHGRLAVPLSPRQLVGASSAATVGPAGSLAERWVWRLRGAPRSPAAARDHAGPGDGAAAMRTRGGDRRREQRRAAWWRSRRWRRNPRVAGSGGGGTARIECGPGARRRTGSG